jgi:hypothetical protein
MIAPVHTLLMVDAERFSGHPDASLPDLHKEIRAALDTAAERAGLDAEWRAAQLTQSTGDGLFVVLRYESAATLIDGFVPGLQDALSEIAPRLRAVGQRLRLRVAVVVGAVDTEDPQAAGVSAATVELSRLLNCDPLRAALSGSDPDVTFVALIVSAETFGRLVRGGHTRLRPSQFDPVRCVVKEAELDAYLYVPVPSRRAVEGDESKPPRTETPGTTGGVTVRGRNSQNVIGSPVTGDITYHRS